MSEFGESGTPVGGPREPLGEAEEPVGKEPRRVPPFVKLIFLVGVVFGLATGAFFVTRMVVMPRLPKAVVKERIAGYEKKLKGESKKEPEKVPVKEPVKEPEKEPVKEPEKEPVKEPEEKPVEEPEEEFEEEAEEAAVEEEKKPLPPAVKWITLVAGVGMLAGGTFFVVRRFVLPWFVDTFIKEQIAQILGRDKKPADELEREPEAKPVKTPEKESVEEPGGVIEKLGQLPPAVRWIGLCVGATVLVMAAFFITRKLIMPSVEEMAMGGKITEAKEKMQRKKRGPAVQHTIQGVTANTAGSLGRRFVTFYLTLDTTEDFREELVEKDYRIRDALIAYFRGRTVQELSSARFHLTAKDTIRSIINGMLEDEPVDSVYFTAFFIQ